MLETIDLNGINLDPERQILHFIFLCVTFEFSDISFEISVEATKLLRNNGIIVQLKGR